MRRFLLLPGNNTLSHLAKSLAVREILVERGHEVHLAAALRRRPFLDRLGISNVHVLPDLGDGDRSALPTLGWFRPNRAQTCIEAECDLIRRLRPDRILGVFRFTGSLSAQLTGVPYDSLVCGAMTRACMDTLGFAEGEPGAAEQAGALAFFRSAGARRLAPLLASLGCAPSADLWQLLEGQRTFLWDTPTFQALRQGHAYTHVGPLFWSNWPVAGFDDHALDRLHSRLAFLAFGTGGTDSTLLLRLVQALWRLDYAVAIALGGQPRLDWMRDSPRLAVFDFLPSERILPRADLVVCHGGQMLVFEALRQRLPVMVVPMQPEQAQNGVCLERLACGGRLLRGVVFDGRGDAIGSAINRLTEQNLTDAMTTVLAQPDLDGALAGFATDLAGYDGIRTLAQALEEAS